MSQANGVEAGDFIEIVGEPEKRGYVVLAEPGSSHVLMVIDQLQEDSWQPFPRIALPKDRVKLVRMNEETVIVDLFEFQTVAYPCLGIAATQYAHSDVRFKPDSVLTRLPRPPAQDLPGTHSSTFKALKSKDFQEVYNEVYTGRFLVKFWHSFWPQDVGQFSTNFEEFLDKAMPQFTALVFVPKDLALKAGGTFSSAQTYESSDGTVYLGVGTMYYSPDKVNKQDTVKMDMTWLFRNFNMDQMQALELRVIHLLLRVVGCDIGYSARMPFHKRLADEYASKGWWKENLDWEIINADIMVHTGQSDDVVINHLLFVARALSAMEKQLIYTSISDLSTPLDVPTRNPNSPRTIIKAWRADATMI